MADNNVRQSLDSFRDQMGKRIKERLARPTIAQGAQEQNERQAERKSEFQADFKADKATYVIMGISAIFTAVLGLVLGLAPRLDVGADGTRSIFFHTDLVHWIIALVYAVAFVTVTEGAFLVAKRRFHKREENNNAQHFSMLFMIVLAGISIIGTGWAGGTVGASVLGFLTEFRDIPASAQKWVVGIIPVLLALYAFCLTIYHLSSEEEKSKRITDQMKRQQLLDHRLQMDMVDLEAQEMMMLAEAQAFLRAVERGALSAGEAMAAKRAGKTLGQLETEKGRDLDGDGTVGGNTSVSRPQPQGANNQQQGTSYTLDQFCAQIGLSPSQARSMVSGITDHNIAFKKLVVDRNMSDNTDISGKNFRKVFYRDLNPTQAVPANSNGSR